MALGETKHFFNGGGATTPATTQAKKQPYTYQQQSGMPNTSPGFDYSAVQRAAAKRAAEQQLVYQRRLAQQRAAADAARERERLAYEQQMREQAAAQQRVFQQRRQQELHDRMAEQARIQQEALQEQIPLHFNPLAAIGMNWVPGITMGGMQNVQQQNLSPSFIPGMQWGMGAQHLYGGGYPGTFQPYQPPPPPGSNYQDPGEWGGQTAPPPDRMQQQRDKWGDMVEGWGQVPLYMGVPEEQQPGLGQWTMPEWSPSQWSPSQWSPSQWSPTRYSSRPHQGGPTRDVRSWYEQMLQWRIGG